MPDQEKVQKTLMLPPHDKWTVFIDLDLTKAFVFLDRVYKLRDISVSKYYLRAQQGTAHGEYWVMGKS